MDEEFLKNIFKEYEKIVVIEEVIKSGSLYSKIIEFKNENKFTNVVNSINFNKDVPINHGSISVILNNYGMSKEDIIECIKK